MADSEAIKKLKDLPIRIQSASLKERQFVANQILEVLSLPDVTEQIVRGLCRAVHPTLQRYRDTQSQSYINNVVKGLSKQFKEWTLMYLPPVLFEIGEQLYRTASSSSISKSGLIALKWSTIMITNALSDHINSTNIDLKCIAIGQAMMLAAICATGETKANSKAFQLLHDAWVAVGNDIEKTYLKILSEVCDDNVPHVVVMYSALSKHLRQCNKLEYCQDYKKKMLTAFAHTLIAPKKRPNSNYIIASKDLLSIVEKKDYLESLLPEVSRTLLRNPDFSLEAVGKFLDNLSFELDYETIYEVGKTVMSSLHSKEEVIRKESAEVLKVIASRCKDSKCITSLMTHLFAVYHGANGKLISSDHKIGVLQGAQKLSENILTPSERNDLVTEVSKEFAKILESESPEKTLTFCSSVLGSWLKLLSGELPEYPIDMFKKVLSLKTTTPAVRMSYLQWLGSALHNTQATTKQRDTITNLVIKSIEKAVQQPQQIIVVSEGICAAYLLVKLDNEKNLMTRHTNVWNAIVHKEKHVLLQEKILANTTEDVLIEIINLCATMFQKYKLQPNSPVHRALVLTSLSNLKPVRQYSQKIVKENVKESDLTKQLIEGLNEVLVDGKVNIDDCGRAVTEFVRAVCSFNDYKEEDAQLISIELLKCTHHPLVMLHAKDLWIKVVRHLKIDPKKLINLYSTSLRKLYISGFQPSEMSSNIIRTLVAVNPEAIMPCLIKESKDILETPELLRISRDDYFVFLTPPGDVYDKSVIPGEDSAEMNMKRESKAYSYKEQQEELQLRRELEERRRKEGKKVPVLTPKQQEAIKTQLAKEALIRDRITELNKRLLVALGLLRASMAGNPRELAYNTKTILPSILSSLQSPLSAEQVSKLFVEMRHPVFERRFFVLSEVIAWVTLRLQKPQCDLEPRWEEESLQRAAARTIKQLHEETIPRARDSSEDGLNQLEPLTCPAFAYTFPLIKLALTSSFAKANETMVLQGLQLIVQHAKSRGTSDRRDLYYPGLLPIEQMFKLLIDLIGSTSGRIQSQSTLALLETAKACRGGPKCCTPTIQEAECILNGLQRGSKAVRTACLRALLQMADVMPELMNDPDASHNITKRFWIARFDVAEENRELAVELWNQCMGSEESSGQICEAVLEECLHTVEDVQRAAAQALAACIKYSELTPSKVLERLLEYYNQYLPLVPEKKDQLGHIVEPAIDVYWCRKGSMCALEAICPQLGADEVVKAVAFMVQTALADRNPDVRDTTLKAALTTVDLHGKETVSNLLPVFEQFLDKAPKTGIYDVVRQAVVILMGSLARHLGNDDPRIKPIALRLIAALSTPSQAVQEAVSDCLPHLIISPSLKEDMPNIVNKIMKTLFTAEKYGDRKGAAYGLAGIVKGLGILALKQYDIMTKLSDAIQEKKNFKYREGALFALEMLCTKLGRLFEPYIVHILPHLLLCYGDVSQYVRAAADDTSKIIMSKLSAHGVKLVLPSLLAALEDDSWRTKTGSIELLGAMAFCAPKQLSSCLPSIVPALIEVLSDSHIKVQEAGAEALRVIGSVIRNPEIQAIVPVLLEALQDPSHKTSACLQTLLETQFVHFIDAPSLALIMPVVQRAFIDRSTETRKMAAQIIGNMYSLTDQKDLQPYLPSIIPGLKTSLLDPVPEVRSVSARALGAMVRGMGESSFEELLPWLMTTLTSDTSSVDRSGAAQGLSEVVAGLGVDKLHKLMPEIISTAERQDIAPHVKDGYIMMFIYMPGAFTNEFLPYIGQIINPILKALADENEYVRETALKAGQRIVNLYAESAITLLLPELEKGLFDDNWRIRYSSVQLLGDLLYRISGVTGKMSTETASEDDNFGTEQSHSAILNALGADRRDRVLAGLYMGRSDVALMVRQAALHVWKVVVTNTPRTLREILPVLFGLLLGCLASTSYDRRQVAARTLGDLVRKLGERVLPEIVPILEKGLESDRPDRRQGVCIGLGEIVASTSRDTVLTFADGLIPTVRKALCDPLPEVRIAAAKTFDSLHATVGQKALDDVLPSMLASLEDPDPDKAEAVLDGLRQVMAIKSRAVLPYLIPQLTASPPNTRALAALASAAGDALSKHLHKVLPALLSALEAVADQPNETQELEQCRDTLLALQEETGVRCCVDSLLEAARTGSESHKSASASLLCAYVTHTRADLNPYVPQLLRGLIGLLACERRETLQMAYDALNALTKGLEAEKQIAHVSDVRQALRHAAIDLGPGQPLPGLCLPKGIVPLLPLFRESILNGMPEDKENAALMLGEAIKLTSPEALQPSVVHVTGPLIRILGDRFSPNVKTAVLDTLALLLFKVGIMLKQFLPQLQTTFIKALSDPNRNVRLKAGAALARLVAIHSRADPLFVEMHNGIKNCDDVQMKETTLQSLRGILVSGGDKLSEANALALLATLATLLNNSEDSIRMAAGGCLGALISRLPPPHSAPAKAHHVLGETTDAVLQHGRSCALFVALKESPAAIYDQQHSEKVTKAIASYISSDKIPIVCNAIRAFGYLMKHLLLTHETVPPNLLNQFLRCMNHQSNEVKQLVAQVCSHIARNVPTANIHPDVLKSLVPALVNGTKEKNSSVKACSETALILLLRLKEGDEVHQKIQQILEVGARESLNDVVTKVLRKVMNQPLGKEEELDCTLVT